MMNEPTIFYDAEDQAIDAAPDAEAEDTTCGFVRFMATDVPEPKVEPVPQPERTLPELKASFYAARDASENAESTRQRLADALRESKVDLRLASTVLEKAKGDLPPLMATEREPQALEALASARLALQRAKDRSEALQIALNNLPNSEVSDQNAIRFTRNQLLAKVSEIELESLPRKSLLVLHRAFAALSASDSGLDWQQFLAYRLQPLMAPKDIASTFASVCSDHGVDL
jgi:hypothetical protein